MGMRHSVLWDNDGSSKYIWNNWGKGKLRKTKERRREAQAGFTLVELLVVIAVIAILIALTIPAVQMVRESARRTQCASQIRQQAAALVAYQSAHEHFPSGFSHPTRLMWSGFILPHIEQGNIKNSLDLSIGWDLREHTTIPTGNLTALSSEIPVFVCPSDTSQPLQFDYTFEVDRHASSYLACASGLINRESGDLPWCGMNAHDGHAESDGVFYMNSETYLTDIADGLSNTVILGEAISDQYITGTDHAGNFQKADHWYIGSRELSSIPEAFRNTVDWSECLGSTACPINALKIELADIDEKELSFGSMHITGVNMAFADGHVQFIVDSIDPKVWSAIGTRKNKELDTYIE